MRGVGRRLSLFAVPGRASPVTGSREAVTKFIAFACSPRGLDPRGEGYSEEDADDGRSDRRDPMIVGTWFIRFGLSE